MDGWFGDPIPFGDRVRYVCDRNTNFEDEEMTSPELTCQGSVHRGYFRAADHSAAWPRCVRTVSCAPPAPPPDNVTLTTRPPQPSVETHTACGIQRDSIEMTCPSFLSIVIMRHMIDVVQLHLKNEF